MKKTPRDHISSLDEFEDLTLFANESFDTQDVDLFEFTSEESSPLTRLKSIILSLDWEINDDILQELDDELTTLQSSWQGDKMAEVYIQGLKKIGNYIRLKGAYAHPNSIKLLLTFFYNFEKITSSEQITGDEITQLLKKDVRKFKILQYQIAQSESGGADIITPLEQTAEMPGDTLLESDTTKLLKAAILSLDWEVTDDNLLQFNERLAMFHPQVTGNKAGLVLVQGLQALGDFIAEKRADAHPESFILLHSFNDALEQILHPDVHQVDQAMLEHILVEQVNRLNNLKLLVTHPPSMPVDEQRIDAVVEQLSTPPTFAIPSPASAAVAEADLAAALGMEAEPEAAAALSATPAIEPLAQEIDSFFTIEAVPAMESAGVQYPDEVLPPDAIQPVDDELADDFIESHLSTKRGLAPALADSDESAGFDASTEPIDLPIQNDLSEQLDFLFTDTGSEGEVARPVSVIDPAEPASAIEDDEGPIVALSESGVDFGHADIAMALSNAEVPTDGELTMVIEEVESDANTLDIQNKLDSFFTDLDEAPPAEPILAPAAVVDAIEESLFFNEEERVPTALADTDEERGFSEEVEVANLTAAPVSEIEERLDAFFGIDGEEPTTTEEFAPEEPATLADTLATVVASSPAALPADAMPVTLAALGALLPGVVRTPSRDNLSEAIKLVTELKTTGLSAERLSLVHLLESVLTMLVRLPTRENAVTEQLVNFLYEQLLVQDCRPEILTQAIGRFTTWLQQAGSIMPVVPAAADQSQGAPGTYTAQELYFELADLRAHIREEFAKLRHELHRH